MVKEGKIAEETLDDRVHDVLYVKFKLGLFDDPFLISEKDPDQEIHRAIDDSLSLQVHRESIILLKNDSLDEVRSPLLPLSSDWKKILVTGPMARETRFMESRYGPSGNSIISIYEGLVKEAGTKIDFSYARGCDIVDETWPESEIISAAMSVLTIDRDVFSVHDTMAISVDITNKSKANGEEVVQLYLTDEFSSLTTYASLLRGFQKIAIDAGETQTAHFRLPVQQLAMLNKEMEWEVEPGRFVVKVGNSSENILLEKRIIVN